MSALELYLTPNSESSYTSFLTPIAIIVFVGWTQMKIHLMYAGELDRYSIAFEKRMSALEGVAKELSATESTHEVRLEEHGEDISLAAETAYVTSTLVAKMTGSHIYGHMLDDHREKFLRTCPKKTVREILSHLSHDEAAKQQHVTRHIVNSRLYSLLRQGKLKKDDSARPVWSVV